LKKRTWTSVDYAPDSPAKLASRQTPKWRDQRVIGSCRMSDKRRLDTISIHRESPSLAVHEPPHCQPTIPTIPPPNYPMNPSQTTPPIKRLVSPISCHCALSRPPKAQPQSGLEPPSPRATAPTARSSLPITSTQRSDMSPAQRAAPRGRSRSRGMRRARKDAAAM